MKTSISTYQAEAEITREAGYFLRKAREIVLSKLQKLKHCQLNVLDGDNSHRFGEEHYNGELKATLVVKDQDFYLDVLFGGSIGAAESFMDGKWQTEDLTCLIRIFVINMDLLDEMEGGLAWFSKPARGLLHLMRRNTRSGSRKNISAHYDLGNEFFSLFLDKNLMYSCAVYPDRNSSLEEASDYKLDRICQKLDLTPDDHVVEIGTGWGGFSLFAARNYGCRVTTTTISREQYKMAKQRIFDAGLEDRVEVLLSDYRDLDGKYDKLVSIEMIEAIGPGYLSTYFRQCADLLKSDGVMLIQAITISDQRYRQALKNVDFIQKYIFPGGFLPSVSAMTNAIAQSSDLRVIKLDDIGPHYAQTLADWRKRFFQNIEKVRKLGYSEEFVRMWEFYLGYCEGGFVEHALGTVHIVAEKPRALKSFRYQSTS